MRFWIRCLLVGVVFGTVGLSPVAAQQAPEDKQPQWFPYTTMIVVRVEVQKYPWQTVQPPPKKMVDLFSWPADPQDSARRGRWKKTSELLDLYWEYLLGELKPVVTTQGVQHLLVFQLFVDSRKGVPTQLAALVPRGEGSQLEQALARRLKPVEKLARAEQLGLARWGDYYFVGTRDAWHQLTQPPRLPELQRMLARRQRLLQELLKRPYSSAVAVLVVPLEYHKQLAYQQWEAAALASDEKGYRKWRPTAAGLANAKYLICLLPDQPGGPWQFRLGYATAEKAQAAQKPLQLGLGHLEQFLNDKAKPQTEPANSDKSGLPNEQSKPSSPPMRLGPVVQQGNELHFELRGRKLPRQVGELFQLLQDR